MENLKDYFDCSFFYRSLMNPYDQKSLLEGENVTKGLLTYTIDKGEEVKAGLREYKVIGQKVQYWCNINLRPEENLSDFYDYVVKVYFVNDSLLVLEVESDVHRAIGNEDYWENKVLGTKKIAPVAMVCGEYHISFTECYSLENAKLVHSASFLNDEEYFDVSENFKLGDAFKEAADNVVNHEKGNKRLEMRLK